MTGSKIMAEPMAETEVTTDAHVAPTTEDPIDDLLREFEDGTAPRGPAIAADQSGQDATRALTDYVLAQRESLNIDGRKAELQEAEQQLQKEYHERDFQNAIKEVRGDLGEEFFTDEFVTTWLDSRANNDQQLQQLWLQREQNPRALKVALNRLAKEFQEKYTRLPDPNLTQDHELVAQSVRGASAKVSAEPPPRLGRMSNSDFRKHVTETYGFDPEVA
jgi:hypothetical protein